MFNMMHFGVNRRAVMRFERFFRARRAANVPDFLQHEPRVRSMPENEGEPAPIIHARFPIHGDMVNLIERDAPGPQAVIARLRGQPRPVRDPAEALLLRSRDEHAISEKAGRGIGMISVEAEDEH